MQNPSLQCYEAAQSIFRTFPTSSAAPKLHSPKIGEISGERPGHPACHVSICPIVAPRCCPPVVLAPPPDAARGTSSGEAVWSVAKDEASVIALAELNRWHGGWYAHEAEAGNGAASGGCAHKSPVPSDCVTGVYHGFRIGGEHCPFISCDIS